VANPARQGIREKTIMGTRNGLNWRESKALTAGAHNYKIKVSEVDELISHCALVRFEAAADAGKRITATRLATLGILALGTRKATGHFFLTFEIDGIPVRMVTIPAKHERDARLWVIQFNKASYAARQDEVA
jgi:hypothetical protein